MESANIVLSRRSFLQAFRWLVETVWETVRRLEGSGVMVVVWEREREAVE